MLATMAANIIGMRMTPELVAEWPWTICTNSGTNMMAPNMAAFCSELAAAEIEKMRLANSRGLMTGSDGAQLPPEERDPGRGGEGPGADHLRGQPGVGDAGPAEAEQQRHGRRHEERGAGVVEPVLVQRDVTGQGHRGRTTIATMPTGRLT